MKIRTLLGSTLLLMLSVLVLIAGVLVFFPQWAARVWGIEPLPPAQIWSALMLLVSALMALFWVVERLFERAGKSDTYIQWGKKKAQNNALEPEGVATAEPGSAEPTLGGMAEQLRFRYGRFWRRKVRLILVISDSTLVEQVAPGLVEQQWQEGEGTVLVWGGNAEASSDPQRLQALRQLRRRPLDAVVWVLDSTRWPAAGQLDEALRQRQKRDALLGWQAPVYAWAMGHSSWPQHERETQSVGCLLPPRATPQALAAALTGLLPALREQGMRQLLLDDRHDYLLRLAQELKTDGIQRLETLCTPLLQGPSALQLRGVMFSLPVSAPEVGANSWLSSPVWEGVMQNCRTASGQRVGLPWERTLLWGGLGLLLLWGAGTVLSLLVNRANIQHAGTQAQVAGDSRQLLPERLRNQLALQQDIARLQQRDAVGAPWYSRFGLNQNEAQLTALWPYYQRNNVELVRDAAALQLHRALTALVSLPADSAERGSRTQAAYEQLKAYLMMARPERVAPAFLSRVLMANWPTREGVQPGLWQDVGPKLVSFYAQNLAAHPEWKITADRQLVAAARQVLLGQIGQRNAETTLYQRMLQQVANNYADLTLHDMVGDMDASVLFSSAEGVPGMFTRQAWEEQVQEAIEQVVTARREEIDWVLSDNQQPVSVDVSPQALKARLTERYFSDFGNAWLNMLNSLRWNEVTSLSDAISQLTLMTDVRQSPLIALMNTVAYQGKTGQQGGALADSLVNSAKEFIQGDKHPAIAQAVGPRGPLEAAFGPLLGLMDGQENSARAGNLNLQAFLTRVTQVRLKLQQVTNAPNPQAMTQQLAQTVFQGKAVDLVDTRDYGSLIAASLGQAWSGYGQAMFVQPLQQAWQQVLQPAASSLNAQWQREVVNEWNAAFVGRYPFASTDNDAALPMLAQYLRADSGRIALFLQTQLGGILRKEGRRWVPDTIASQGLTFNPRFLQAIEQLSHLADTAFAQGDAGLRFELMARPSREVARTQLEMDGQTLDYFNQMESWQRFAWPGQTYHPGVQLSWRSVNAGMRLYADHQGAWGFIRLLENAKVTPLDSSRYQLVWQAQDGLPLNYILRTEMGEGPLALLALRGFTLPAQIFITAAREE